ncbi:MAG TPA: DNA polymerase III subunit chi [Kiloniellales bacterium]|nr:DNA polymerase III subunit chi [Kiloniellales bacterium]
MTEVRFYQLGRRPLVEALAVMLERVLERGQRGLVLAASNERVESLADALWTWRENSFLPHGTAADGQAERQPIWLSTEPQNPNGAQVLFLLEGVEAPPEGYDLVAVLFDGADAEQLARARRQWSGLKAAGHALSYWAEDAQGRWTKQA